MDGLNDATFVGLPADELLRFCQDTATKDPRSLMKLVVAHPNVFLTETFNLAELDAQHQVREQPVGDTPRTTPLINLAIEEETASIEVVRQFLNATAGASSEAINGIYPGLRAVEPPMHTAVRLGRVDVLTELLSMPNINPWVKYTAETHPSTSPKYCVHGGLSHPPPCTPNEHSTACQNVFEYAAEQFSEVSNSQRRNSLLRNIDTCATLLFDRGLFTDPFSTATNNDYNLIFMAIRAGMDQSVSHALNAALSLEPGDVQRQRIVNGMPQLLRIAAAEGPDHNEVVRHILSLRDIVGITALPEHPVLLPENPCAAALVNGKIQTAINILKHLATITSEDEAAAWVAMTLDSATEESLTDQPGFHRYCTEQWQIVRTLLGKLGEHDRINLEDAWMRYVRRVFQKYQESSQNTTYLIQNGNDSGVCMQAAIQYRNDVAVSEILKMWRAKGIDINQAKVPMLGKQVLPLEYAIWDLAFHAIIMLLNEGADENLVTKEAWRIMTLVQPDFLPKCFPDGFPMGDGAMEEFRLVQEICQRHPL
ncbi:hypothetical protein AAE478_001025 [Parahypoxylon ruwenzoriense]